MIDHWLQGGPCESLHIFAIELPDEIEMVQLGDTWHYMPLPDWPDTVTYRRESAVEQLDAERIYYPAGG